MTVATAAVVLAETAPPAVIGIMFLGDHTRPGLAVVAVAGFASRWSARWRWPGSGRPTRAGAAPRRSAGCRQAAEVDPSTYTV